jgi:hypothetical protein
MCHHTSSSSTRITFFIDLGKSELDLSIFFSSFLRLSNFFRTTSATEKLRIPYHRYCFHRFTHRLTKRLYCALFLRSHRELEDRYLLSPFFPYVFLSSSESPSVFPSQSRLLRVFSYFTKNVRAYPPPDLLLIVSSFCIVIFLHQEVERNPGKQYQQRIEYNITDTEIMCPMTWNAIFLRIWLI